MGAGQRMSQLPYRPWWQPYQDQLPEWRVWRGDNKRFYARLPGTDPLVIVNGQDAEELRDEIIRIVSQPG